MSDTLGLGGVRPPPGAVRVVVAGLGRRGHLRPTRDERPWADGAEEACVDVEVGPADATRPRPIVRLGPAPGRLLPPPLGPV